MSDNRATGAGRPLSIQRRPAAVVRAALTGLGLCAAAALCGCEADSWLLDPSAIGRWEDTPTIVPVLEKIDVIESDTGDFVDVTQVQREDLIPQPLEVKAKPGDALKITILDFPEAGRAGEFERVVDNVGCIDLPALPRIRVEQLSIRKIQEIVEQTLVDQRQLDHPIVQVEFGTQQEATFRVFGAIEKPGQFRIPGPDYRLLQALTDAGGVSPVIRKVFVIRQVSLAEEMAKGGPSTPATPDDGMGLPPPNARPGIPANVAPPAEQPKSEDLLNLIDELTKPATPPEPAAPPTSSPDAPKPPSMGARSNRGAVAMAAMRVPDEPPPPAAPEPAIDLPDSDSVPTMAKQASAPAPGDAGTSSGGGQWMFINGEWVQVFGTHSKGKNLPEGRDPLKGPRGTGVEDVLTQRVIEVPVGPLLQGSAQYNIVLRPNDIISVPPPEQGFVYVEGPGINRPGVYSLPSAGQLTIQRVIAAAGGMSQVAVPERVDLTRRVGDKRQATVRLNLKAIYEGTQPDIVLRADDLVNLGTNFWATPLAIIRNGFRMTYGFGFLLDRNFGSDVFGVPPEATARNSN